MSGPPAIQLYTGDWLKDPSLSKCSPSTRGIWFDAICAMHENGRSGRLTGSYEQLSRVCRCSPEEMESACAELGETGTAALRVTESNGIVTLENRRMSREAKVRQQNAIRQRRFRESQPSNEEVTIPSSSSSSTSSSGTPPLPPSLDTPRFRAAWSDWTEYRKELGLKPYKPRGLAGVLKKLERAGEQAALWAIEHSIGNNYQGLFPEKFNGSTPIDPDAGRFKPSAPPTDPHARLRHIVRTRFEADSADLPERFATMDAASLHALYEKHTGEAL
jgi:hypothetical protein